MRSFAANVRSSHQSPLCAPLRASTWWIRVRVTTTDSEQRQCAACLKRCLPLGLTLSPTIYTLAAWRALQMWRELWQLHVASRAANCHPALIMCCAAARTADSRQPAAWPVYCPLLSHMALHQDQPESTESISLWCQCRYAYRLPTQAEVGGASCKQQLVVHQAHGASAALLWP
jgi:hypothetical protein